MKPMAFQKEPLSPTEPAEAPVLDWLIDCHDVDRRSQKGTFETTFVATPQQRAALCAAIDLAACGRFSVTLTVRPRSGGRYAVTGRMLGDIEQACVVTLDPLQTRLDEPFAGVFCPAADLADAGPPDAHFDPEAEDEPMPVIDDRLAIGQLVYEHLALAIDPFPRRTDAQAVTVERGPGTQITVSEEGEGRAAGGAGGAPKPNPFAVLAKLKPRQDD
jgi:uncharacterized metal-binding protein YceD (DUF177 family)